MFNLNLGTEWMIWPVLWNPTQSSEMLKRELAPFATWQSFLGVLWNTHCSSPLIGWFSKWKVKIPGRNWPWGISHPEPAHSLAPPTLGRHPRRRCGLEPQSPQEGLEVQIMGCTLGLDPRNVGFGHVKKQRTLRR